MKVDDLENIILGRASSAMKLEGKALLKLGLVKGIKTMKISNIYHIYGQVTSEDRVREYTTHIRIDLETNKLDDSNGKLGVQCYCDNFKAIAPRRPSFMCEHLTATAYGFLATVRKKLLERKPIVSSSVVEKGADFKQDDINITENNKNRIAKRVSSGIGEVKKDSLGKETVKGDRGVNKKSVQRDFARLIRRVSKEGIHYEAVESISLAGSCGGQDNSAVASQASKIKNINSSQESSLNGGVVNSQFAGEKQILKPEELREFLLRVCHKKVKFTYDHLEFTAPVLCCDLPLKFTLKGRGSTMVLTTQKQFPTALNEERNVFLYNWQLYLPSQEQIKAYTPLERALKKDGELVYARSIEEYNSIISVLGAISKDISISEDIKNFMADYLLPEFYVYRSGHSIYCDVSVRYGDSLINILDEDDSIDNNLQDERVEDENQALDIKSNKFKDSSGKTTVDKSNGRDLEKKSSNAVIRDYRKEEKIIMQLEAFKFIVRGKRLIFIGGEDELTIDEEIFRLLSKKGSGLYSLGNVEFGRGFENFRLYDSTSLQASIVVEDNYYGFSYNLGDLPYEELNSAYESYKEDKSFYKTKNNNFIDFEDEGIRDFFNLLDSLDILDSLNSGYGKIDKCKELYLNEAIGKGRLGFIKGRELLESVEEKFEQINSIDMSLPENLNASLRAYQLEGFKWFKTLSHMELGGILADEMGLGKTIQTIAFLLAEKGKKSIIVCPSSLVYNWKYEIERFAPDLTVAMLHGAKSKRMKLIEDIEEYDVLLTTYGTLRMDIDEYDSKIFDYCIIDEGQNIKNSVAQNARVVKQIKANVRFALTGTPIENNIMELWSIFDFIMPGYLYSKEAFENKFLGSKEKLEELKLMIKPFILRRTKSQVMRELPDKLEKKFLVEMTSAQKSVYKSYIKFVQSSIKNNSQDKLEVFSYLTKLRQICLDPSLILEDYEGGSGKLKICTEIIKEHIATGGKLLLFSQFTSVLSKIAEELEKEGIKYLNLDGSTKPKERIELVNQFNESKDIKVFLISLKAGGTGLNLTSANLVIHFDPWWNPSVEAQATDRAHRIGQKNRVEVIKLVARGTIEEKIVALQQDKKDLIDSIITDELGNQAAIKKLTRAELIELFCNDK